MHIPPPDQEMVEKGGEKYNMHIICMISTFYMHIIHSIHIIIIHIVCILYPSYKHVIHILSICVLYAYHTHYTHISLL